jgi:NAD+ synthase
MRDYEKEFDDRVAYIRSILAESGMSGVIYGNSGGKDSALVGILCKAACGNTLGVIMPCASRRNFSIDKDDALTVAKKYGIDTVTVDLTSERNLVVRKLSKITELTGAAVTNIAPRLRMLTLYTLGASTGRLVAGTGNRSEAYMGYFTKWGDGAYDFDPIADLTVKEIYEFLDYLDAPECVRTKAPSAGLFDGQTDEGEMGVTYAAIDTCLLGGEVSERDKSVIEKFHSRSAHKRRGARNYPD